MIASPRGGTVHFDTLDGTLDPDARQRAEAWLRRNDPVHWDEKNGFWLLLRHADVLQVSKQPEVFSSALKGPWHFVESHFSIQAQDGPLHLQARGIVSRAFTPRMIAKLEERALRYIDEAIDAVVGQERCDLVSALAVPVPMRLIADMVGVEEGDLEMFRRWGDLIEHTVGRAEAAGPELLGLSEKFRAYLEGVARDRRRAPREDLISMLVAARERGLLETFSRDPFPGISGDELTSFAQFLVLAGNETTRNAISQGILALLRHPEERRKLAARPELLPGAVEEVLRYTSVIRGLRRTAARDVEVGGRRIRAGESVVLVYPSANRDEAVFEDPDAFRVERDARAHLTFGIGTHFCLGASLARMELRVVIGRILQRLPELALDPDDPVVFGTNPGIASIARLPVRLGRA
jgi:cytochrome P450 family 142 subfamily A polypeptide 1